MIRVNLENSEFQTVLIYNPVDKRGKTIPVTGCGGSQDCEMSRLPHFLDNRLTDGGEVVSLTRRPPFTSRKIPGTHILCVKVKR
jgi:hypothetical protein